MTLLAAVVMEWLWGDPPSRWHPVAWFGRWAGWWESRCYADSRMAGMLGWGLAVVPPMLLIWAWHGWAGGWFDVLLLWCTLGWKSLFVHVRAVLEADDLPAAREAVARIVSRDTGTMDMSDARRAALESLAENASDAVVAPLFWFVVLGAPGAALYRMINTLDAMWGYRTPRYRHFGWWAAKTDDVVNWLPARITAMLMLCCGNTMAWRQVASQARTHASPNAGWPEAALAWAAGVRLGGMVWRAGMPDERPDYGAVSARTPDAVATGQALGIVRRTLLLATVLATGIAYAG